MYSHEVKAETRFQMAKLDERITASLKKIDNDMQPFNSATVSQSLKNAAAVLTDFQSQIVGKVIHPLSRWSVTSSLVDTWVR